MPRKLKSTALRSDAVTVANIPDGEISAAKLHSTAIQDKLGYTPVSPAQLSTETSALTNGISTKTTIGKAIAMMIVFGG